MIRIAKLFLRYGQLEEVLVGLAGRRLVQRLERQPGQKESRYQQLLTIATADAVEGAVEGTAEGTGAELPTGGAASPDSPPMTLAPPTAVPHAAPSGGGVAELAAEVNELKRRFEELLDRLGETIE